MPIKIFVSHASLDEPLASALVDCIFTSMILADNDLRCTSVAGHKLDVGTDFTNAIREDLDESSVVVGVITPNTITSGWVLFELGAAWGAEKNIKPLVSDNVNVSTLPGALSGRHVARLSDRGDVLQFLDELQRLIAATPRSPSKRNKAIDSLLAAHADHLKAHAKQSEVIETAGHHVLDTKLLEVDRAALRFGITLGWQLGRYEFAYGSQFPEAQAAASSIVTEIERLLVRDSFPEKVNRLSYHDLISNVMSHYSTTSSGKYAAIMLGIAAMRASLVGVSKDEEANREMERLGFSALGEIDPLLVPDKAKLYQAILERKPKAVVEVMQVLDKLGRH